MAASPSEASTTSASTATAPSFFSARRRRSPAINSYPPGQGLTTGGDKRPSRSIDSASEAMDSS